MRIKITLFLTCALSFSIYAQVDRVGINTAKPQTVFHVDGGIDNNKTGAPNLAQTTNDVVFKKEGNVGVATINPPLNLWVKGNKTGSDVDGLLLPKLPRTKLQLMDDNTNIVNGTLVFVDNIDGNPDATTKDVLIKGFYFYDKVNSQWQRFGMNEDEFGMSVSTALYTRDSFTADSTKTVACGKFEFRYNDSRQNGRISPEIRLRKAPASDITLKYALETRYAPNGFEFAQVTRTFSPANDWQTLDSNAGRNRLAPAELNILYVSYPADNLYKRVTFYGQQFGDNSSVLTINCEIE